MSGHRTLVLLFELSGWDLVLITGRVSLSVVFLSRCIWNQKNHTCNHNLKGHCSLSLTQSKGVYSTQNLYRFVSRYNFYHQEWRISNIIPKKFNFISSTTSKFRPLTQYVSRDIHQSAESIIPRKITLKALRFKISPPTHCLGGPNLGRRTYFWCRIKYWNFFSKFENFTLSENYIWNLPIFYLNQLRIILHKFFLFDHINIFYGERSINYRLLFKK